MRYLKTPALGVALLILAGAALAQSNDAAVRAVVEQFESGLQDRDLKKIESIVADDMVAFENGHRNDTWADFRDHHLVPEMKEPAPQMTKKTVRVSSSDRMGWAYTQSSWAGKRANGDPVQYELWSIYVLEKRGKEWKIVVLDWSMRAQRPKQ